MKAVIQKLVVALVAVFLTQYSAHAQVYAYSIFKVANYRQVDSTQPTELDAPDAYYFGAQLNAETNSEIINDASVTTPDSAFYWMTANPVSVYFSYNSDFYPDLPSLDADFPAGDYTFSVNDGADSGTLTEPADEIFTSTIPYFTGDTWSHLQHVNAARPLHLCWNSFVPDPGSTSAFVFVRILDPYYNYAYTTNFLASDTTNICIPEDSLLAGTDYTIQLLFSDREDDVNYGFDSDAAATAGFDVLTYTSLITDPPLLCIGPGTNSSTVTLSWSISASNYSLESTTQLSDSIDWTRVNCAPTVANNENVLVVPTCGQAKFFQLYIPRIILAAAPG